MAKRSKKNERVEPVVEPGEDESKAHRNPIPDGPVEMRIGQAPELGQQIFLRKMLKQGRLVRVRAVGARVSQAALVVGSVLHEEFGLKPPIHVPTEMLVEEVANKGDGSGIRRHYYVTVFIVDGSKLKPVAKGDLDGPAGPTTPS